MNNYRPKIGIRPITDGRRGRIRKSREAMTTEWVRRITRLGAELRDADGTSAEYVIADSAIGGAVGTAAWTEKFRRENLGNDLATPISMLHIPAAMLNLPEEVLFRSSAWSAFGPGHEGSGFRACKNYEPLYC